MDGHNTNSSPQSEAQFVPRLNKSLPMKYAKQFYCLVTLSSEACCLIHDDNISPCICAFVCVFKSRTLRKRRVWEFIKKKDRGRRQVAGVRRKLYFCQGDFARLIQRNCVSVTQTMREKRGETPQSNTWVKEEKPKRKSEELKWKCEKRRRKHKCTQNFNALHMYRHKNLHRYRKPQKLFPIIKVSGHYLQEPPAKFKTCWHLQPLEFVMVLCYRSPRNSKSPANPTEHKTAMYLLTMGWITKTCHSNSRNRRSDVTAGVLLFDSRWKTPAVTALTGVWPLLWNSWVSWCVIQCSYYSAKMTNEFTVHVSRSE